MTLKISPHAIEQDQGPFIFPGILVGSGPGLPSVPDGTLHVWSGSAGAVTAHANADDLVVESDGLGGISILVPDVTWANIYFGQAAVNNSGFIRYGGVTETMQIGVAQTDVISIRVDTLTFTEVSYTVRATGQLILTAGVSDEVVINEEGYDVNFRVESDNEANMLYVDGGTDRVGIAIVPTQPFHVFDASGGWGNDGADAAVAQFEIGASGNTACTTSWLTGTGSTFDIMMFAAGATPAFAILLNNRNAGPIILQTSNLERFRVSDSEVVVNEPGYDVDFRVESDVNTHALFVQGSDGYVGVAVAVPLAQLHIDQAVNDAVIPVLILDQADISEGFINFIGSDRGVIAGATASVESVRVELGGVVRRLALYADA